VTGREEIIRIVDVWRIYNTGFTEVAALRGVSLSLESGEFVAVMGPSGSGKSTLLNILGCLDRPTRGRYVLAGQEVQERSDDELAVIRNRHIGFVFQTFNLLPRMTAQRNVEQPMLYARVPAAERRERAREALERVGLGDRLHHRPNELSGGQQQRVAIARALVMNPDIILADEPTGNLDSRASEEIMDLFQALNEAGVTIIVVTHDEELAVRIPRVVRLRDGKVVADGLREEARHTRPEGLGS